MLNVATTRLILTKAATEKMDAAGGVIQAFGEFVSGDSIEVGLIIFGIIMLIQFIVITKGSGRISEVPPIRVGRNAWTTDGHRCRLERRFDR